MIQINLLPPEYRAKTGTPVARFVAIVSGVVVLACASGAYAYTHFIELAKVRELRQTREEEALGQERRKKHSLDLQSEIDLYEKRRMAIQTINRSRTLWSRKLDQFFDIVTNQGTDETYKVWIEKLEVPPQLVASAKRVVMGKKGQALDGGQFRFSGFMAMEAECDWLPHISAFHKALTGDPESTGRATDFFADFMRVNNPNGKIVGTNGKTEEELLPPVVGSFDYELTLLPKVLPAAEPVTAAKPARKPRNKPN
jgi:cell division protein FtsB